MPLDQPYPDLGELLATMGEAGLRLSDIDASEGAAGNISICVGWPIEVRRQFPVAEPMTLPEPIPEMADKTIIVTGSGRRLRDVMQEPVTNLGVVVIAPGGAQATLHTHPRRLFARITSEFNSHLAVHRDQVQRTGTNFHAIIHAQPLHITYLSHIAAYRDETRLNRNLLRWQPELIVNLPEGIGSVPFLTPGSAPLMQATVEALRTHRVVVWSKHGVMARSDVSAKRACDRVEYVETAARYEYLNLANGERGEGLSVDEIRQICREFGVKQQIY